MRALAVAALLMLALAGCADDDDRAEQAEAPLEPEPVQRALPANFTGSGDMQASVYGFATGICQDPHQCVEFPFAVGAGWSEDEGLVEVEVELLWGVPTNDFDLYLYEGGVELGGDYSAGSSTRAFYEMAIPSGDYAVLVDGYLVAADSFDLAVTFQPA